MADSGYSRVRHAFEIESESQMHLNAHEPYTMTRGTGLEGGRGEGCGGGGGNVKAISPPPRGTWCQSTYPGDVKGFVGLEWM